MSSNVKIIYPEKLISVGDLVRINPLYIPQKLFLKMNFALIEWNNVTSTEWPYGVVLALGRKKSEKWCEVGFPQGNCEVPHRAIILC
tara:strand:- start:1347 stop:1607 length:261 start_codon:yes stop_codon:yes gene_type:complete